MLTNMIMEAAPLGAAFVFWKSALVFVEFKLARALTFPTVKS